VLRGDAGPPPEGLSVRHGSRVVRRVEEALPAHGMVIRRVTTLVATRGRIFPTPNIGVPDKPFDRRIRRELELCSTGFAPTIAMVLRSSAAILARGGGRLPVLPVCERSYESIVTFAGHISPFRVLICNFCNAL